MLVNTSEAKVVGANEGAIWNVLGTDMLCKVRSEETGGAYSIVENNIPPQEGTPPHHICRYTEKMSAILPICPRLVNQFQIRFVNQRSRL